MGRGGWMRPCSICGELATEHMPEGIALCPAHLLEVLAQAQNTAPKHAEKGDFYHA